MTQTAPPPDLDPARTGPRVEVLVSRHPDAGTDIEVFIDGARVENPEVTVVDPGCGWDREDWDESAAEALAAASPAAAELLTGWYGSAGESPYITGGEA